MSSRPTQVEETHSATAESPGTRQLNEWRDRIDSFAAAFDAEIAQILTTLATLQLSEVPPPSLVSNCDKTMEFTLPATPPPAPRTSAPPEALQPKPMPESVSEPNRLAALKAKLSQQMASTGHPHAASVRTAEADRS